MRGRPSDAKIVHLDSYSTLRATLARNLIDVLALRLTTGIAVVQVCGEVDASTAPMLRAELVDQLNQPPTMLVLDLTRVTFLAASGVLVLLETHERAALTGTPLCLVHTTRAVRRVLDVLQLDHLFESYPTLADACASQRDLYSCVPPQAGVPDTHEVARHDDPPVDRGQKQQSK
jgi:anti-anti-sigma factor